MADRQVMRSVLSALRVMEAVADHQPAGVGQLARALALPKSSVQRALWSLHEAGWIMPAPGEMTRWVLTTRVAAISRHLGDDLGIRGAATPVMHELNRETDETVHLIAFDGKSAVLVERVDTNNPVRVVLPLGTEIPLHGSANGKAILAASRPEDVEHLLHRDLPRLTHTTIVGHDELLAELHKVRARGYATNDGEWRADITAVAAAIVSGGSGPVGSMSISVPRNRMRKSDQERYGALIRDAAGRVSAMVKPQS